MNKVRNIYFVRHGETDANATGVVNSTESQLTQQGIDQSQALSNRMRDVSFSAVYTSQLQRAIDTGTIIASPHQVEIKTSFLLNERKKPSSVERAPKTDVLYKDFLDNFLTRAADITYRYEDGENLYDVVERGRQFLEFVEKDTEGDLLVVTHGAHLRLLVTYILTRSSDMDVYAQAYQNICFDNTGITHVKLFENGQWQFGTINDSTHLN